MNKKLLIMTLGMLLSAAHPAAYALGLSDIKLNSSLNQSLDATVDILSATLEELNSLNVSVSRLSEGTGGTADMQHWPEVKIELVRVDDGKSYLKLTSEESVREPVLKFLLELEWATGRIIREYSLLINPQL